MEDLGRAMERLAAISEEGKRARADETAKRIEGDRESYFADLLKADPKERDAQMHGNFTSASVLSVGQLRQWSKSDLAREIQRLNGLLNRVDMAGIITQALDHRAKMSDVPKLQHAEAFMLMTYRTDGGAFEQKIWNSRDGVTPFQIHIDGQKYTHAMHEMQGPFMDRPEGCVAQWETRTEMAMMLAWRRALERALLAGQMTKEKANELADNTEAARANQMWIGLRSFATGKFTDEA